MFFFAGLEVAAPEGRPGLALRRRADPQAAHRRLLGVPDRRTARTSASRSAPCSSPQGFPGAGTPAPGRQPVAVHHAGRPRAGEPVSGAELRRRRTTSSTTSSASSSRPTALDFKTRFDYNISSNTKAYVRVARESEEVEGARGVWWGASEVALPSPNVGENVGRSVAGSVVSVLSPTMTNEALVSWSRLTLDNTYKDPSKMTLAGNGVSMPGPFGGVSPYIPGVIPNWGGGVSNMWAAANDMYAHNDELHVHGQGHEDRRRARPEVRGAGLAPAEAAELQQQRRDVPDLRRPGWTPGSTGNAVGDILTGRITQMANAGSQPPGRVSSGCGTSTSSRRTRGR